MECSSIRPNDRANGHRATIDDVAKRAFVSKTTVSHTINGTRFVSEETRERVLQAVAALNYRPSAAARSLTTKRSGIIGIVVPNLSNIQMLDFLLGLSEVLTPAAYSTIVCDTERAVEREPELLEGLLRQNVDGIISASTSENWLVLAQAERQHTPIVFVDRPFEGLRGPFVGVDNHGAVAMAVRHLVESGQRQIGIVAGPTDRFALGQRLTAFRETVLAHGLELIPNWIAQCGWDADAGRQAAREMLSRLPRPTALVANTNVLSLGTMQAIVELGLRCPRDVAVIGIDDHPWATVSNPPLSVIRVPFRTVGQKAASMLLDLLDGNALTDPYVALDCTFIVRQSCCLDHFVTRSPDGCSRIESMV